MKKITIQVKGMHCKSCEMLIIDTLEEQEGVKNIEVSHNKGTVIIFFDEKRTSENQLKLIIKNEGYEVY
ncbi:MAG: heavy-metal-associated domain-containing protein [Nanoarchaeota archaeon]|nr:cation transporter [Nanoarchaeota archaeon]MBU1030038.1 cation transporter [Nanoarchaeota archaeon]MBU1850555.1 cation transporter [Nanoarchaeota archaeon]